MGQTKVFCLGCQVVSKLGFVVSVVPMTIVTITALCTGTSILQLVCPPTLRAFPMRFLLGLIYLLSHYQHPCCVEAKSPKTLAGKLGPEDALPNLLSTSGRWPGTRFLPTETLSSLVFFSCFVPLSKVKRELAGIQKKPGKRSLLQRRSLSETHGLSDFPGHCFKASSTDGQLRNKRESLPRHQTQAQPNEWAAITMPPTDPGNKGEVLAQRGGLKAALPSEMNIPHRQKYDQEEKRSCSARNKHTNRVIIYLEPFLSLPWSGRTCCHQASLD